MHTVMSNIHMVGCTDWKSIGVLFEGTLETMPLHTPAMMLWLHVHAPHCAHYVSIHLAGYVLPVCSPSDFSACQSSPSMLNLVEEV